MTEKLLNLLDACQNTNSKSDFEALRQAIIEQSERLALTQEDEIEKTRHLVGYYHKAETADECDFYFLDAINGDCPDCHPCYADTAALEKPAKREPLSDEQFNYLVMENLGPHALTGGKMSVYDAFLLAVRATEAAHGITKGQ